MQSIIKIVFVFGVLLNVIVCQQNRDLMLKNLQIIKDRCDRNAQVSISIERIAENIQNLTLVGAQLGQRSQHDIKYICKHREMLTVPMKNFLNFIQQCLPKDEQYTKEYFTIVIDEILDFLCRNDGANIDVFTGEHWQQCAETLSTTPQVKTDFETCMNDVFDTFSNVTTKETLCKKLKSLESCLDVILKRYCYQYSDIRTTNAGLFEALTKPCSACTTSISLFLLFFTMFITKIFA